MANIKSSQKDIKRIKIRMKRNKARMSEIKTLTKKLDIAVGQSNLDNAEQLFKDVQAKISRAKGKGLLKANTASRKISALAKSISKAQAK